MPFKNNFRVHRTHDANQPITAIDHGPSTTYYFTTFKVACMIIACPG